MKVRIVNRSSFPTPAYATEKSAMTVVRTVQIRRSFRGSMTLLQQTQNLLKNILTIMTDLLITL
jgi:hypothetical protein